MRPRMSFTRAMKGFTLIELLVVVAIIAVLISILLPSLSAARCQAKRTKCGSNLHSIGQAINLCWTENRGYGPGWDDGGLAVNMLTWYDVLFDMDYSGNEGVGLCPADARPDGPAETRGRGWNFWFVDDYGVNRQRKPGVRGSYAINALMHWNHPRDKFDDAARQVFAIDGWWTWFGSLNAVWLMHWKAFGEVRDPLTYPNWEGTMVGWRHCKGFGANTLYVDGHVSLLVPRRPHDLDELRERTIDTSKSFTWLPGERSRRFDFDPYGGEILEWRGRNPSYRFDSPKRLEFSNGTSQLVPQDYPEELNPNWRTDNNLWRKLPSRDRDRR